MMAPMRSIPRFTAIAVAACALAAAPHPVHAQAPAAPSWDEIAAALEAPDPSGTSRMGLPGLLLFLDVARAKGYNLFQLLCEAGVEFKGRGLRVAVSGDDLRAAAATVRLGDHRVDALLPVAKVVVVEVGASRGGSPEIDIRLTEAAAGFLELGDFSLKERYGFRTAGPKSLSGGFGAKVKNGPFDFDLSRIEIIPSPLGDGNPNFIAIHLALFPRPKRWHIDPVRLHSEKP